MTEIVEGWTGILGPYILKINGVPLSLTGLTVSLNLRNALNVVVVPGGTVTPDPDQVTNTGYVRYSPVAADFVFADGPYGVVQAYKMHWKVVDGAGKIVFFPSGAPDEIGVYRA